MKSRFLPPVAALAVASVFGTSGVLAHVGDESTPTASLLPPAALVQLETVRQATARFLDVDHEFVSFCCPLTAAVKIPSGCRRLRGCFDARQAGEFVERGSSCPGETGLTLA